MNVYSIDILIGGTAYIKAESEEEALSIAKSNMDLVGIEFSDRYQPIGDNICMDGRSFQNLIDHDEEIALSPVMTIHKVWDKGATPEFVEELEDVEDA